MEMTVIVCLVASVVLLCILAVMSIRQNWQKAFMALLGFVIFLLLIALLIQSHVAVLRLARMQAQAKQIEELTRQVEELNHESSIQASKDTGHKLAEPHR
jgi:flagellar biosynthesis/type III secretory pathway M-ring protein FliF/YscJ